LALDFPIAYRPRGRRCRHSGCGNTRGAHRKLAEFEAKTSDQLVVVTLKSLGTSVEDFGVELGRRWQISRKGKNNGVRC
jgi:hypothetical protein